MHAGSGPDADIRALSPYRMCFCMHHFLWTFFLEFKYTAQVVYWL